MAPDGSPATGEPGRRSADVPEAFGGVGPQSRVAPPAPGRPDWPLTATQRIRLLVKARNAVLTSLDPAAALQTLAGLLVPALADWCALDLLEDGGTLRRAAVAHADPARLSLVEGLRGRYPVDPDGPEWPAVVVRTGRTLLTRNLREPGVLALTRAPEHVALLEKLGARSAICTSLRTKDAILGVMTLVRVESYAAFRASDAAMAMSLGGSIGQGVVHGRLYLELQAANQAKDEFMAMLGHELRNPIGAIVSAVSVLERLGTPDDGAARVRAIIGRQARHLGRLVDDLLDVARLTSGKITLRLRPVDLARIARRYVTTLRLGGATERHEVVVDAAPALVTGDSTRLEQVLSNLVDNSLKYTPPGGRIAVTVRSEGSTAVLRVEDTGMGIAPDALPRVFDLFTQGPQPLDRERGGLGLGLTLVRRLVELHGGTVEAASGGPDQGATMTVRLPLAPGTLEAGPAEAPAAGALRGRRILVVEDNADVREALRQILELEGHHVEVAEDAARGIELAVRAHPDVALVDIGLPGRNGYDLAREIRGTPNGRQIYLVALTGYGQPADRALSKDAGFDAHLVKPVDPEALYRVLTRDGPPPHAP